VPANAPSVSVRFFTLFNAMIRYLNSDQKAIFRFMLNADEPLANIAATVRCSVQHCQRLKRHRKVTGEPFWPSNSRFNAVILAPWAVQLSVSEYKAYTRFVDVYTTCHRSY